MKLRFLASVLMFLVVGGCFSLAPDQTASPPPSATPPANATPSAPAVPTLPPGTTPRPRVTLPFDVADILTASLNVTNMSDEDITVTVAALNPDDNELLDVLSLTLRPFETIAQETFAAQYRLEFQRASSTPPQVCLLDLQETQSYSFVALVSHVAVARAGTDPQTSADLIVDTSPLCHAWVETQ